MISEKTKRERIIRKPELLAMLGLSDPTVWRKEKRGEFPKRLRLGAGAVGWLESEINAWLEERKAER